MGPRAGLDGCGKSRPHPDSIPGPVAIPTELTSPPGNYIIEINTQLSVCKKVFPFGHVIFALFNYWNLISSV